MSTAGIVRESIAIQLMDAGIPEGSVRQEALPVKCSLLVLFFMTLRFIELEST